MAYFTNISTNGKVRYGKLPFAVTVLESRDTYKLFGMAFSAKATDDGLAVWRLTVHGEKVRGRFVIIDGKFIEIRHSEEQLR
jgi:hypothetical protein